jgi:hypothetical protein
MKGPTGNAEMLHTRNSCCSVPASVCHHSGKTETTKDREEGLSSNWFTLI